MTIDERIEDMLDVFGTALLGSEYECCARDKADKQLTDATQAIKQLITEARIDEAERLKGISNNYTIDNLNDRIATLKGELK